MFLRALLTSLLSLVLGGCDHGGTPPDPDAAVTDLPTYRPPTLTAVRPPMVSVGAAAFVLAAEGTFDADAIVLFDGVPLTTRVVSPTAIEADVPATAIVEPGSRSVQVVHTGDGGGLSSTKRLEVVDGVAGAVLDVLVPDRLFAGSPAATISVDGWNFIDTSVVMWNGTPRPTTFVGSTRLRAVIPASDFAAIGTADVTVATPDAPASTPLVFTIADLPLSPIGVTGLITVTTTGTAAGGLSVGAGFSTAFGAGSLSSSGRYVAFASTSTSIVAADGNALNDVFVRDTCHGATSCTPATVRVSVSMAGSDANGASDNPSISGTGRYVAFSSDATDLVTSGVPGAYVRDTCAGASGCTPTTILASVLPVDGSVTGFLTIDRLTISRDGRLVAFEAYAGGSSIYVSDTCLGVSSGCTPRTERVSTNAAGTYFSSKQPALSADGRFVAFQAQPSGGMGLDGQPATARHIFVVDTCHGATGCTRTVTRATVAVDGTEPTDGFPFFPTISDNGRYVGFASYGVRWTSDTNPNDRTQVFVRDTCIGASGCTPATTVVSGIGGTASNHDGICPAFSADTRFVAFHSMASDLVVNDTNARGDIFVRDRCLGAAGCTPSVRRVSVTAAGVEGNDDLGLSSDSMPKPCVWISGDGSLVSWATKASNFVANDTNAAADVFVAGTGFPQ